MGSSQGSFLESGIGGPISDSHQGFFTSWAVEWVVQESWMAFRNGMDQIHSLMCLKQGNKTAAFPLRLPGWSGTFGLEILM